ncbi:Phospholipase A1-II 7 [Dichanthelium oligosanthes]|uniref:Phospholipase A1 n=1 Tax=Dichanthelium oligosanthes TaxID=888268 RepID=A0A1E5V098_9POAL|nr:Phospholipase A1-II 7 [Dichanthelium oligosanthes]
MAKMLPVASATLFLLMYFLFPSPSLGSTATRWRELQGSHSWNGLLDPLDIDLRKSLIAYGELVQATYDSFNRERRSPHAGACVYGRSDLLPSVGVAAAGSYAVTKFVYSTSAVPVPDAVLLLPLPEIKDAWSRESNWMGYVAVATDEGVATLGRRDIVVVWRGTVKDIEWANDFSFEPVSAAPVLGSAAAANPLAMIRKILLTKNKFHACVRVQVFEEVRRLMELYKDEVTSITIIGHSLGAALATLNAVDIASNGLNVPANSFQPPCPVTAIVYACPHVGDGFFKAAFGSFRDLRALHVKNAGDAVPMVPPLPYVDAASVVLPIDTSRSPYLRIPGTPKTLHVLECYLHGVAGEQGSAGGFKLEVDRDVALVNKDADALKDEYPVPANWWVAKNRWMVKGADGHWTLNDFEEI